MSRPGYQKLDGVRLKFRTTEDFATATIWIDGEPKLEIARLDRSVLPEDAGAPEYHAWVDAVMALVHLYLSRVTGVPGFTGFRERPNYKGEDRGHDAER